MHLRIGAAAALTALLLAGAGGAQTFSDPVGDTKGPDIDSVSITHDATTLHVDVHIANRTRLEDDEAIEVEADLDSNAATGEDGIDLHALYVQGEPGEVLLWENGDYVDTNRATITWSASAAHLRAPVTLVRGTAKVDASAIGVAEPPADPDTPPPDDPVDAAPDTGTYAYTVERHALTKSTLVFIPAQPRAGKPFRLRSATLQLAGVGTVSAKTTCTATLGGKKFGSGCTWRLPKTAKGRVLAITIVAVHDTDGYTLKRRFVVRA